MRSSIWFALCSAQLETVRASFTAVITQNIDGLHQAAGSRERAGTARSILRNYCQRCGKNYDAAYVKNLKEFLGRSCGGTIKPDVVPYEESLTPDGDKISGQSARRIRSSSAGRLSSCIRRQDSSITSVAGTWVVISKRALPQKK